MVKESSARIQYKVNLDTEKNEHSTRLYFNYTQPLRSEELPYRMIKSRWLVGTDDLFTVETIHSSRVSKFWFFFEIFDLMTI